MQWLQAARQIELEIGIFSSIAKSSRVSNLIDLKTCFFKRFFSKDGKKILRFHVADRAEAWSLWESSDRLASLSRSLEFANEVDIWVLGDRYAASHPVIEYEDSVMESLMSELWNTPSSGIADAKTGEMLWIHPRCWETIGLTWAETITHYRHTIKDFWNQEDAEECNKLLAKSGVITGFLFRSYAMSGNKVVERVLNAEEIRIVEIGGRSVRITKGLVDASRKEVAFSTKGNQEST